jgi:Tetraspanin family
MTFCCEKRTYKLMLGLINYLAAATGVILLSISAYGLYATKNFDEGPHLKLIAIFTLSLGAAILLLAVCEYFGRAAESYYMTTVYSHMMMAIMTCVTIIGAVLMVGHRQLHKAIHDWLAELVRTNCLEPVELLRSYVSNVFLGSLIYD